MATVHLHPPEVPRGSEGKARRTLVATAWALALLLLAVSPWGWGGAVPVFASILMLGADLLLLLTAVILVIPSRGGLSPSLLSNPFLRIAAVLGLLFALFSILQTLPVPESLLATLSPSAAGLHVARTRASLSLSPEATRAALVTLLSAAAFFLAPVILLRSGRVLTHIMGFLAASGGVVAAYALLNYLSGNELSLHFAEGTHTGRASGPFVNPNHLATFLAVLLPAPLAVLFLSPPRGRSGEEEAIVLRVSDFIRDLSKRYWKILSALALAFIVLGLVFTMSRAGILASATGVTAFLAAYAALRRKGAGLPVARMLCATAFIAIMVGAALWLGLEPVMKRYAASELGMKDRLHVWAISLEIFYDFPLFGTGLGTFTDIFPLRQPPTLPAHYTFPHNEFIGILVECGVVGTLLLAGSVVFGTVGFVRELVRKRYRRTRQLGACWAVGGAAAFAFHAVFDFAAHLPAVAFLAAFTLGVGFASIRKPLASARRRRNSGS